MGVDVEEVALVSGSGGVDVGEIGLDSVWAVDLLEAIGRAFAARIDFSDPDGLEFETEQPW